MANTQRRFAVMGENLFRIINKIITNQRICRLLKYQCSTPFDKSLPDVDGIELLNKEVAIVPKLYEKDNLEYSYIVVLFNKYIVNPNNSDFKISEIRFEVICPFNEWILDEQNLRPYLLMQELDNMFNQAKLSGIGNLQFVRSDPLVLSPHLSGYTLIYQINDFN